MAEYVLIVPTDISLTYNLFDGSLSGDTKFPVSSVDLDSPSTTFSMSFTTPTGFTVNPNPATNQKVQVGMDAAALGITSVGNYTITFESNAFGTTKITNVHITVINEDTTVDPPLPDPDPLDLIYQPKYELINDDFTLQILQLGYQGEIIPVYGYFKIKYQSKDDLHDPIISSNLQMFFDVNTGLTLEDLYSEKEKEYKVEVKKGTQKIFIGWVKPDGIWEDYVNDRWQLSITAYDGLSTLKDISFSLSQTFSYSGMMSLQDIIQICLNKTGLTLPLNVNCNVYYDTLSVDDNVLKLTYTKTERYFTNNNEPMDCESILKSILILFNLIVVQYNGEWFIYRPIDVVDIMEFKRYDELTSTVFDYNTPITIGSQIDNFEIFHCNANQKKSIAPSVQAYRLYYEYGGSVNVLFNSQLTFTGTGLDIPGWTVNTAPDGLVMRDYDGSGLRSKTAGVPQGTVLVEMNQNIDILASSAFTVRFEFNHKGDYAEYLFYSIKVGSKWFKLDDGSWQSSQVINKISNAYYPPGSSPTGIYYGRGDAVHEVSVIAPESGSLMIKVYRDVNGFSATGIFTINGIYVTPQVNLNQKGKSYTGLRKDSASTFTKRHQIVYNGDSISDLFVGTLYKSDKDTPTSIWYRLGFNETKELLEINVEDNLRISPRPMTVFEGDVYGYIPYLSKVSINNFNNKAFQITNYTFNSKNNITELTFKEYSREILSNNEFIVDVKLDYKEETKVTIK